MKPIDCITRRHTREHSDGQAPVVAGQHIVHLTTEPGCVPELKHKALASGQHLWGREGSGQDATTGGPTSGTVYIAHQGRVSGTEAGVSR